jgi:hypothetical protein
VRYNISVRTELAADLPQIVGDRVQLQQVAMNLIVNSIEAMKDVDGIREMVIKSQRAENEQILVSVSDTGIGFPPQLAEQIFDPFFTTKPHGTGMGLRISRSIIESHGGRLWDGVDEHGGRVHDLLGTRCDPYVNRMLTGEDFHFHCHSNLTRAIAPYGLTEYDVHDVLNVFQCTGLNLEDKYFMKPCSAKKGDYLEFFAEIDLLCALSTCPGGDLSLPMWGQDTRDRLEVCRPLGIEIYRLASQMLDGWTPPAVAAYKGQHGMTLQPVTSRPSFAR